MPEEIQIPPPASKQRRGFSWALGFTIIALALIAAGGYVLKVVIEQPARIADSAAKALQPQINVKTLIQTSLDRLRDESKLVVYTADVAVMITKFSDKKILYGKIDLGTTTVRVRSAGNRAQIIVPLKSLAASDFRYDSAENTLFVTVPEPRVDESLVEIQTDPAFYEIETDVGWARMDHFSGEFLRDQARRDMRPAVILEASNPRIINLAKKNAQDKISALLEPVLKAVHADASLAVEFKPHGPTP